MKEVQLKDVKKGEYVKFTATPATDNNVWIKDDYDRGSKKFTLQKFSDVGHFNYAKGTRKVFIDFNF